MKVFLWDPFVVGGRVAFPSDEVLLLFPSAKCSLFDDLLDFPFRFTFFDLWWQFLEVWSMLQGFLVRSVGWEVLMMMAA